MANFLTGGYLTHPYKVFVFISNYRYFNGHSHRQVHVSFSNAQALHVISSGYSKIKRWREAGGGWEEVCLQPMVPHPGKHTC